MTEALRTMMELGPADDAVAAYLTWTGCSDVDGIWLGLRRRFTPSQVRSALKKLDTYARKMGGQKAIRAHFTDDGVYRWANPRIPVTTEHSLKPWKTASGSTCSA